jgi:translation initiation factor 2B subunit (eIF-2B alpha/beta/delta family)
MAAAAVTWWVKSDLDERKTKELESLIQQACGALQAALTTAYQSSSRHVNRMISALQTEATDALQNIIKSVQADFENKQAELDQRKKATIEEVKQGQQELAKISLELQSIQKSLTSF